MKKICVVTGSRAEYGLLKPIMEKIRDDKELQLSLVVTGMHLSPEFGLTYQEIESDGFRIDAKNEMLLSSDTPNGITKSLGLAVIGFADIFTEKEPDMLLILGDRFEIYAAAIAAMVHRIPISHMHGGELTEGAIDDAIRHSITKMSLLHFTSTEEYRRRVIQLGEEPDRVFNVGALGVENIHKMKLLSKEELEKRIGFTFNDKTLMVTFHPVTLEEKTAEEQFENLLRVLEEHKDIKIIFTKANADTDGRIINQMIDKYIVEHENAIAFFSMGQLCYFSALRHCLAVIGNSSSGILEVPSFGIPTINIGNRQKGRVKAHTVIDCETSQNAIESALKKVLADGFKIEDTANPYDKENTAMNIVNQVKNTVTQEPMRQKTFIDISEGDKA